jgi:N-acetylglucosamine kinase-like BadF-type ATPase
VNSVSDKLTPGAVLAGGPRLILGVDGGGSKTLALLAALDEAGKITILGRGRGGASNLRLSGKEQSLTSLDQAVDAALGEAGVPGRRLDCSVLALAGSTSPDVQNDIKNWADKRKLSSRLEIVHDAMPVLAHGTPDGWGIALIVGTGSVAVGVDPSGNTVIKGGWGHWFGDKGSGFYLGYKALAAVAEASDEIGPETLLSELVLEKLGTEDPRSILKEVSAGGDTRRSVAALAPLVMEAAERRDKVARGIIRDAVAEAVKLVAAVAKAIAFDSPFPLALAGGVICNSQHFRDELLIRLNDIKVRPAEVTLVNEPVMGCLKIARTLCLPPVQIRPEEWFE